MGNATAQVKRVAELDGAIGAALVDSESGMTLASVGGDVGFDIEMAAASTTNIVQAQFKALSVLHLHDDIEDILVCLGKQYHIIRPLRRSPTIFYFVALDRTKTNLALSRRLLADIENNTTL